MRSRIVTNPASDERFSALTAEFATLVSSPAELAHRLRAAYPLVNAVLGVSDGMEPDPWYVYRDGRWVNPDRDRARHGGRSPRRSEWRARVSQATSAMRASHGRLTNELLPQAHLSATQSQRTLVDARAAVRRIRLVERQSGA
jgi:hypothetical protein